MPKVSELHVFPGYALVKLGEQYKNIQVKEGKYDSRTTGILMEVYTDRENEYEYYERGIGKEVWFDKFSEGARLEHEGVLYAFVETKNLQGYRSV
jgi:hypothetical protein